MIIDIQFNILSHKIYNFKHSKLLLKYKIFIELDKFLGNNFFVKIRLRQKSS